jgi:hypothetical protein
MGILIRIRDNDSTAYDLFFIAPDEATAAEVDAVIVQVKEANPDEYQYADLVDALAPLGIVPTLVRDAGEWW